MLAEELPGRLWAPILCKPRLCKPTMGLKQIHARLTTAACGLLLLLQVQGEALMGVTGNLVRAAKLRKD